LIPTKCSPASPIGSRLAQKGCCFIPIWLATSRLLPIYLGIPTKLEPEYRAIAAFQRELSVTEPTGGVASPPMSQEV